MELFYLMYFYFNLLGVFPVFGQENIAVFRD
jgi:hypothetical protein